MASLFASAVFSVASRFRGNNVCLLCDDDGDEDFKSFLEWFHKLDPKLDGEFYCIPSCDPNLSISAGKQRTLEGKVTSIFDDYGLIDDHIYFTIKDITNFGSSGCPIVGDPVRVQAEQTRTDGGWKAFCVSLIKDEVDWDEDDSRFRVLTSHEERGSMIGKITSLPYNENKGTIEGNITFAIRDVDEELKLCIGDWVQANVSEGGIATSIHPLRSKQMTGTVTYVPWKDTNKSGCINDEICFMNEACADGYRPRKGDKVVVTAIESEQGLRSWRATEVKFLSSGNRASTGKLAAPKYGSGWTLRGETPYKNSGSALPSFLPQFGLPNSLRTCVQSGGDILHLIPSLKGDVTFQNYAIRFAALLHLEELALEAEMQLFQLNNVILTQQGEFLVLHVPGIMDGRPSLRIGDIVIVREISGGPEYQGFIHFISVETEELLIKFHKNLLRSLEESTRFDAFFTYSRTPFRRCHLAVNIAKQKYAKDLLFPSILSPVFHNPTTPPATTTRFFNSSLNERQRVAVQRMMVGKGRCKPYILFGPPGTGKTVTLVESILQIVKHQPSSRLLVCAPSNSAVDLLCERLHDSGAVSSQTMVRYNAFMRPSKATPDAIAPYCHPDEPLTVTARYRVVLTTCVNAGNLYILQLRTDHFTHVYIDEAGQASEPESLIPIGLGHRGEIFLAGDPEQLGAVMKSSYSKYYGLNVSLLERLMKSVEYSRNELLFNEGYNPLLVTKLVNNYRSHPELLHLPSRLFYNDELNACADEEFRSSLCQWEHLPNKNFPLLFHGIMGNQLREEGCSSWFNAAEIVQATRYVTLLINDKKIGCIPEEVGIITPYKKQVEKMRMMCRSLHLQGIKIGSVEEFQGQERRVIILSTVRSSADGANRDIDGSAQALLGFLSNPKRFNVAITRAQALMIVIGNPFILIKDEYWKALLKQCVMGGGYTGCDISGLMPTLQDNVK